MGREGKLKIVIVGPGAMGCLLAAFLSKSKEDIWFLDHSKERAAKITQTGISLEGISGNWQVKIKASADTKEIGQADLIIICVKSYDTKQAIIHSKALIGENSTVLTLQNGIGNIEIIAEAIGNEKVIGGVTNLGVTLLEVGKVRHAGKGETIIGRIDGKMTAQMRSIREIFNRVGLEAKISRDIKGLIWSKLIVNVGINALTAITRLQNGRLAEFEGTRRIMREAVTEAIRIAKRKRIKLTFDDPLAKVEAVAEATSTNISSMLQDVLRKKRTEIDFINGVIVRQGHELGIPVPVNQMLVDLVKTIEASYDMVVDK
ncbi:MAG: 2-dehydropantoate 2-reductase [Candidatus Omnitrophica bacterium CG23_combo_of_CG06-09_8_20_14_all_41_10]|uniref:2-dehydropantoate 2-reductase n=1 Tax=Candidatus Sherwoodlollariibacterium unditelluris TaxID=1974757 RepID=A0A2G9YH72_9BACT|nr:MAG: 2-dehydropantoate 2-reductase [Candidatus Omnitrophica bacterium CG23_combo_of_CG06-09_8_20_14_all_41_10]